MSRRAFERLNADRDEKGLSRFANPRNAAAGSLRLLEPQLTASRRLEFYTYFLLTDGKPAFDSHWGSLEELRHLGFKVNPHSKICRSIDEVIGFCNALGRQARRACRTKSTAWWSRWIRWSSSASSASPPKLRAGPSPTSIRRGRPPPRWKRIEVQVGRTGALTPVAHLEAGGGRRRDRLPRHAAQRG